MANHLKQSIRMATRDLNAGLATALIKEAKRQLEIRYPKKLYGNMSKKMRDERKQKLLLQIGKLAVVRVTEWGTRHPFLADENKRMQAEVSQLRMKGSARKILATRAKLVELVRKYNELSR